MANRPTIGSLRHAAQIQQRTIKDNTIAGYPGWMTVHTTRASLSPLRARSFIVPDAGEYEDVTHLSNMRLPPSTVAVKAGDRIVLDTTAIYLVVAAHDWNDRGRWLSLSLKEDA